MEDQDFPRHERCQEDSPLLGQNRGDDARCIQEAERRPGSGAQRCASENLGSAGNPTAPDGGWAWVVLAASTLVTALTLSFPDCIGVFYRDLQKEFNTSNKDTSWVPAIMTSSMLCGGPLCSFSVEWFGCRLTVMGGGLLSGLAMAVSSQATSIGQLYITSAITGLGFCFCFQPSSTILFCYFDRHRRFASSLSYIGPSVGRICLPQLANALLSRLGWRGSFLVLGGLLLNCCVCGAVMRPVPFGPNKRRQSDVSEEPEALPSPQETRGLPDRITGTFNRILKFLCRHLALDVLKTNARYRAFVLSVAWMTMGFSVPLVYLVPYATNNKITQDHATLLLTILGVVSIVVRTVTSIILYTPRFSSGGCLMYVFSGAALLSGISICICATWASFEALVLYVVIFGSSSSVCMSLLCYLLMDVVGMSRYHSALGLLCLMQGAAMLSGPPIAGEIVDYTGRYSFAFYSCSACVSSAALFLMGSLCYLDIKSGSCKPGT